jgi:OmpA-OmpF porin, OOP family
MKLRALVLPCLLSAGLLVPAAHAQRQGTLELGLYARKNWFGDSYALENRAGGGARLGFFLLRHLELEANGVYTPTNADSTGAQVRVMRFNGTLSYSIPMSDHAAFIIGGGYTYNKYKFHNSAGSTDAGNEKGPGGTIGFRFGLGSVVSIRLDGTFDYFSSPDSLLTFPNVDKDYHYGAQAGLSFLFGNRGEGYKSGSADADGDGVNDSADQCPGTPKGTKVNSSGCPLVAAVNADSARMAAQADSLRMKMHADSVAAAAHADSVRMASEAAAKAEADRVQAQKDSMAAAAQANEARIAALEDSLKSARGAALRASLRDSLAAARMRDSLRVLMATPNAKLVLAGVNFATNSATLVQSSRFILDEVAKSLVANPDVRIEVSGHTDNTGSRALNERLSKSRAETVKQYLVDHGVSADRLQSAGYAWDRPVASNKTVAGRAMNRRTELDRLN